MSYDIVGIKKKTWSSCFKTRIPVELVFRNSKKKKNSEKPVAPVVPKAKNEL